MLSERSVVFTSAYTPSAPLPHDRLGRTQDGDKNLIGVR